MRLSQLRPCAGCGEGLGMCFFEVRVRQHVVNAIEARKRVAMDTMFPGAPGLAATMSGDPEDGTQTLFQVTVLLCSSCFAQSGEVACAWDRDPGTDEGNAPS